MRRISLILYFSILMVVFSCSKGPANYSYDSSKFEQAHFQNPENSFRSIPFWSLNDSLDAGEIERQLALFKEGGFGGSFLHSRIGLLTPYLSEAWFDAMEVGVKASQELGLEAWFYDEDKWPSGFAGGIVPRQSIDYRARTLRKATKDFVMGEGDEILIEDGKYIYVSDCDKMGQSWFNGTCWVDLMNPDMVKAFIECSYKPYVDRFGGQNMVFGMFTDEPQISTQGTSDPAVVASVSYSPYMQEAFKKLWGYELNSILPSLFDEVGEWRKARLHYYRTVAYCMEMAFSKQIGEWCEKNSFVMTGHYNGEDSPYANMMNEGNLMQQLRHMQQPGIDALALKYQTTHNAKVNTSVANQYGKEKRLSELFGISGHNVSFEDRMWITAWHTIMGINVFCPHLSLYSMKGERKRDFPPTINYQQPYWGSNKLFEDYSARLSYFATVGKNLGQVCVISPIESNYTELAPNGTVATNIYDAQLEKILNVVISRHLNVDIADEQIMSDVGSVEKGMFVIGESSYNTVILPRMSTIRPSTLALLQKFAKSGGNIIIVDTLPRFVEGEVNTKAINELKAVADIVHFEQLPNYIDSVVKGVFTLTGENNEKLWSHIRTVDGGYTIQISNTSRLESITTTLKFTSDERDVRVWDPLNGKCFTIAADNDGCYSLKFAPAASYIVTTGKPSRSAKADGEYQIKKDGTTLATIDGKWSGVRLDRNAIPLDYARYSVDGGKNWSQPEPPLAIWDRYKAAQVKYNGPMTLRYNFNVKDLPKQMSVAIEQPWMYNSIKINGKGVKGFSNEYFVDAIIRTADITSDVKEGINEIELQLDFVSPIDTSANAIARYGTEIETIYLCGDFAVEGKLAAKQPTESDRNANKILPALALPTCFEYNSFVITKEKSEFEGSLTTAGYPFYAGRFELTNNYKLDKKEDGAHYYICFNKFESILIDVKVNGKAMPTIFSTPWSADVTEALKEGDNEVVVTFTNSLRNLMGPHHNVGAEHIGVGPATFRANGIWPNDNRIGDMDWYNVRLKGDTNIWRNNYYNIQFGFVEPPTIEIVR